MSQIQSWLAGLSGNQSQHRKARVDVETPLITNGENDLGLGLGLGTHAFNPSTLEKEVGGFLTQFAPRELRVHCSAATHVQRETKSNQEHELRRTLWERQDRMCLGG